MSREEIKIEELKVENEKLKLVLEKERNKESWIDNIWAFVPFIGMFYWFVHVFLR